MEIEEEGETHEERLLDGFRALLGALGELRSAFEREEVLLLLLPREGENDARPF